jgi:hypothetical protein
MSQTKGRSPSLKSIEKECNSISFNSNNAVLLMTSSRPESTLASAVLARALIRSNKKFHITFVQPVMSADVVNETRSNYDSLDIFIIGATIVGSRKIKKGKGYPVFIGGQLESENEGALLLGTSSTVAAAAYALARVQMDIDTYDLQIAAAGVLIQDGVNGPKKGANKDIIELAESKKLIDERKGFRLFGVGMLPLGEALLHSTYPYLHTISGNQKVCDEILRAAEIPNPKLRSPLSELNTSETQSLTSQLITRLDPETVTSLLGTDFILTHERETSPMRYVSGIEIMANTAWSRNELGMSMSVWLGDRGRALRVLIDSQMAHHKEVLSAFQKFLAGLKTESTSSVTLAKFPGSKAEILSDVGRIALSSKMADSNRLVVLDNDESYTIVWANSRLRLNDVLRSLIPKNITLSNTTQQSITITGPPDMKESGLQRVLSLSEGD